MTLNLSYTFDGLAVVDASIKRLANNYKPEVDEVVGDFAKEQRAFMKAYGYPAPKRGKQPFKTDRQRRYFFWALRNGVIQVPYPRTGRLANSWRAEQAGWADWFVANSATYAAWVIGKGRQSAYHAGHWWIAQDILDGQVDGLADDITEAIVDLTKGMGST